MTLIGRSLLADLGERKAQCQHANAKITIIEEVDPFARILVSRPI